MSIETKAKTAYQIKKDTECPTPDSSTCVGCTFGCEAKENIKYVLLEDAQKEIAAAKEEAELWKKNRNIYVEKKNKLWRQIEAVKKLLTEIEQGNYTLDRKNLPKLLRDAIDDNSSINQGDKTQ